MKPLADTHPRAPVHGNPPVKPSLKLVVASDEGPTPPLSTIPSEASFVSPSLGFFRPASVGQLRLLGPRCGGSMTWGGGFFVGPRCAVFRNLRSRWRSKGWLATVRVAVRAAEAAAAGRSALLHLVSIEPIRTTRTCVVAASPREGPADHAAPYRILGNELPLNERSRGSLRQCPRARRCTTSPDLRLFPVAPEPPEASGDPLGGAAETLDVESCAK